MTVKMNSLDEFGWTIITFILSFFTVVMNQMSFDIFFPPFEGFLWFSKMRINIIELQRIFDTKDFRRIAFFGKSQYSGNTGFRIIMIFGQSLFFEPDSESLISFVSFREREIPTKQERIREKKNSAEKKRGLK